MRVFARDSTQWSQLVLLAVLLVVYVANVRYLPLNGEGVTVLLRNLIPFLNLALAGFVLASIAARFVFPSVSLEGRALWLLRSSPLPMGELLWAKFWVGAVPLLVLALVLVGATNVMLRVTPFVHLVSLVSITALVFPLTALALVFALFRLNPAPFCLMDEVDAPLDDSNTERFCALVRKMSERTQFLFVSHNKITMEMAQQLVGVTMQESGVSRIVEVDIEAAVQMQTELAL
jgi:hypothetical protein